MPRNPLKDGSQPFDPTKGEKIINVVTQKVVRVAQADGSVRDFVVEEKISRPSGDGTYIDSEILTVPVDRAGNPLPDDARGTRISHSGLFTDEKSMAECSSWLHFGGSPRIIHIGQDGRLSSNGAICSRCDSWLRTIWLAVVILILAAIVGVFRGVGHF